jgi:hypothetical protein
MYVTDGRNGPDSKGSRGPGLQARAPARFIHTSPNICQKVEESGLAWVDPPHASAISQTAKHERHAHGVRVKDAKQHVTGTTSIHQARMQYVREPFHPS